MPGSSRHKGPGRQQRPGRSFSGGGSGELPPGRDARPGRGGSWARLRVGRRRQWEAEAGAGSLAGKAAPLRPRSHPRSGPPRRSLARLRGPGVRAGQRRRWAGPGRAAGGGRRGAQPASREGRGGRRDPRALQALPFPAPRVRREPSRGRCLYGSRRSPPCARRTSGSGGGHPAGPSLRRALIGQLGASRPLSDAPPSASRAKRGFAAGSATSTESANRGRSRSARPANEGWGGARRTEAAASARCLGDGWAAVGAARSSGRGPSPMAQRRLAEALQLSRDLVIVECGQDQKAWAKEGSCSSRSLTAPQRVPLSKDPHGIYSLGFTPDGGQLAAGFGNGVVQLVDAVAGLAGPSLFPGHHTHHAITAVNFHRLKPELLLAAGADGTITIYDLPSQYPVVSLTEKENEINALDVSRDGSAFATAGKDRHIRLYDSHTNQLFHVMEAPDFMAGDEFTPRSGHSRRIFALRFHPTELHLFLTGGWDNSVKVWDKRVHKGAQGMLSGPHICGPGIDVKGNQVLTGSWVPRNALQMWDLRMARLWQNLPFPGSPTQGEFLYSAQFCAGNMVMAGGSGTCGASLLHAGTGQVVGEIHLPNKPVHVVASAPGGQLVAVAGAGGNLHFAELN
ncbi:uncharacterized WD repeat-containing protein all2124-like [Eublepharis macularius]|uniref:Uncharacterized WD repeat-containing protein all2124-like n=1 Tax=Eublepharis macularius TaxID=481883 RepID=A0AA97L7Z1_EUBMA|nr:uncharacterized WD repeat-containing protein all2124-like [Eublepharis macularius]